MYANEFVVPTKHQLFNILHFCYKYHYYICNRQSRDSRNPQEAGH